VDWINIADARALTEQGLARRNRGGWEITTQGLALIGGQACGLSLAGRDVSPPPFPSSDGEG